jgi:hypothetical protein
VVAFGRKMSPGRSKQLEKEADRSVSEINETRNELAGKGGKVNLAFGRAISPGRSGGVEKEENR